MKSKRIKAAFILAIASLVIAATVALSRLTVSRLPPHPSAVATPLAPLREPNPIPEKPALAQSPIVPPIAPIPLPPMPEIDLPPPTDPAQPIVRPPVKNPDARISERIMFPPRPGDRVAAARIRSGSTIRGLFASAGVKYPADRIFLRGLKREGELELWAANRQTGFKLVSTYAVAALSGRPGPKRLQGDQQVPEGFYEIDRFNPVSNFHLSLGLNYPNAADRLLGHPQFPGADIFIHGNALSIGCLAMGDDRIEEIYLAALDSRARPIPVHLFPARLSAADWPEWHKEQTADRPDLAAFWEELRPGWEFFEAKKEVPKITIRKDGRYRVEAGRK